MIKVFSFGFVYFLNLQSLKILRVGYIKLKFYTQHLGLQLPRSVPSVKVDRPYFFVSKGRSRSPFAGESGSVDDDLPHTVRPRPTSVGYVRGSSKSPTGVVSSRFY